MDPQEISTNSSMFDLCHNVSMESTTSEVSILSSDNLSPPLSPVASVHSVSSLSFELVNGMSVYSYIQMHVLPNTLLQKFRK